MMLIKNEHNFGDIIYLKTDKDQYECLVTGILVTPNGITYRVNRGTIEYYGYEMEFSLTKNVLMATTS